MKKHIIKTSVFTGILGIAVMAASFTLKNDKPTTAEKGFAVVELFTSEGCSSCPSADELVARVEQESAGKPIYILAFHVDYWNRLGWKDIFSSSQYTARQNQYASWLHLDQVYTPQAIVNGHTEFVGSEEKTLRSAISTGLQKNTTGAVTLTDIKTEGGKVNVQYHTTNPGDHAVLQLALVQKHAVSHVKNGENGGRTLSHVQIVRVLQTVPLSGKPAGEASLQLPQGFTTQGYEVIAFVQNSANGQITAATKAPIAENLSAGNNH